MTNEKFNAGAYRDSLAHDLKATTDREARRKMLTEEQQTMRYKQAAAEHAKEIFNTAELNRRIDSVKEAKHALVREKDKVQEVNKLNGLKFVDLLEIETNEKKLELVAYRLYKWRTGMGDNENDEFPSGMLVEELKRTGSPVTVKREDVVRILNENKVLPGQPCNIFLVEDSDGTVNFLRAFRDPLKSVQDPDNIERLYAYLNPGKDPKLWNPDIDAITKDHEEYIRQKNYRIKRNKGVDIEMWNCAENEMRKNWGDEGDVIYSLR